MNVRWTLCLLLFLLIFPSIQAQDKIVTTMGDTIKCRIVSVSNGSITYEQSVSGGGIVGRHLSLEQVSDYYKGTGSFETTPGQQKLLPEQRWQIGVQGGTGFMLASTKDMEREFKQLGVSEKTAKEFCKNLKWSYSYGADIHYMFDYWGGIGVKYSGFYTSAGSYLTLDIGDQRTYWCTDMEKRIYTSFIGFSFRTQQYFTRSEKFKLTSDIAFGYAHYRDEEEYDYYLMSNYLLKSNSIGGNLEISIEYSLSNRISIGVGVSCFGAWFWKGTLTDGYNSATVKFKDHQMENINASRLDLLIGAKFYL